MQRILAVYGTGDIFAFTTGRYRRFFEDIGRHWGEKMQSVEIEDGGHFWMDARARRSLFEAVEAFIRA